MVAPNATFCKMFMRNVRLYTRSPCRPTLTGVVYFFGGLLSYFAARLWLYKSSTGTSAYLKSGGIGIGVGIVLALLVALILTIREKCRSSSNAAVQNDADADADADDVPLVAVPPV